MKYIKKFEEITLQDLPTVGGKNASLGEMIQKLSAKKVLVPSGFAITADAYREHLQINKLVVPIEALLKKINKENLTTLTTAGKEIRALIAHVPLPEVVIQEIRQAYQDLEQRYGILCDVAVRSSATAEDLPEASFAGQQETFLNIRGIDGLLDACRKAYASLFTDRAISYRIDQNFDHMEVALSIGVQKMVRSDKGCSGVMFTLDTESGFPDVVMINASYGLGENIVQGTVVPDEFYVHKPTLKQGFRPILKKRLGNKHVRMVYTESNGKTIENVSTTEKEQKEYSLTDDEIIMLAQQAIIIEDHYSDGKGAWSPMDIEWGKDGIDGNLYILQARSETIHARKQHDNFFENYVLNKTANKELKTIVQGKSIGRKISVGKARIVTSAEQMGSIKPGDILVTEMTDPDWEPIMKIVSGIITNRGGRTCHAAIVSRELGVPAIVGTHDATELIQDGQEITIDCSNGEVGNVYEGLRLFDIKKIDLKALKKPEKTKIMINVGNPDESFNFAKLPVDGVGLARLEFIINASIKIHPMALVHYDKVTNADDQKKIEALTTGYTDKQQFFIDKLAQEAGTIAATFYPRPVIIRLSDFKSNEYRNLIAGSFFEPVEQNPMIGFRGASRYHHPAYQEAFALECAAMKKMREEMGLTNIKLMVPFVRTVQEGKAVIDTLKKLGLVQGENGLEIYMMCEIPSNVILIDQFLQIFDGYSIGSNDLTQMILAVDRDSELIADIFDERNDAVKAFLIQAIEGAKRNKKPIGICGQAPSDYPEIAELLLKLEIDSMSLNPDAILNVMT